jgi:phospholipid/cholesterol/gamma-HCH transport system substrate-binding protein
MNIEAKVGFFVVLGIAMLFLLTTQVSEFKNVNADGYRIQIFIDDSTGVEKNSKVKMSGIDIGWVESFSLSDDFVILNLFIESGYEIPRDSEVQLIQESLLGTKLVSIIRGNENTNLENGDFLKNFKKYSSFEKTSDSFFQTSEEFRQLAKEIRATLNQDRRDELEGAVQDLSFILKSIRDIIGENRGGIKNSISYFEEASSKLPEVVAELEATLQKYKSVGVTLDDELPKILISVKSLVNDLNETVSENREPLNRSLNSVDSFFSKGEDTIKELDKIILSLTEAELQFSMREEYNLHDDEFSTHVDIAYLPNPNTYYLFALTAAPDYSQYDENGNIGSAMHKSSDSLFSIQYGKRYGDWLFRAGLIQSTGGFGVEYFGKDERWKASVEAFDFSAEKDIRNSRANIKALFRYRFYDHIDLFVGGDNLINDNRGVFMGLGFYFIDNDLKSLVGLAGSGL